MNNLNTITKKLGRENVYPEDFVEAILDNVITADWINQYLADYFKRMVNKHE